jgi:hypothetical protein
MTNSRAAIVTLLIVSASPAIEAFSPAGTAMAQLAPNDAMRRRIVCTEQYAPVCGRLGKLVRTYPNACFARTAGAELIAQGACADTSSGNPGLTPR